MKRSLDQVREALASRYRVERELGSGASATVYLAHDLAHDREVAVKVLNPDLVKATGGQRFLREIEVAASLKHPNLVAILDSGELGGEVFYVTPHIAGGSLRDLLKRERQLSIRDAVHFTRELANALAYIHAHGIVHRDVKPENILLDGQHACLADFGIARALDRVAGETITSTGLVVGTPAYMSPEQASGERAVDARSDQYSLACVAYEMIAGVPPFIGATAQAVIAQRFAHDALPLSHYRKIVPPHIETAIARALELNPADRYPSVERLAASLADASLTSTAETWGERTSRAVQRRWFTIGAATVIVLLAVLGFWQGYPRVQAAFGPKVDSTQYVVLPFVGDADAAPWNGAAVADSITAELLKWSGLRVADELQVRDAIADGGGEVGTLSSALDAATRLRSGRLIWGSVREGGAVHASLFDVRGKQTLRSVAITLSSSSQDTFESLVRTLLSSASTPPSVLEAMRQTRSLEAFRAFEIAHAALAAWRLVEAESAFVRAATADPRFGSAQLWRSQLASWRASTDPAERREPVLHAMANAARLPQRDSLLGSALIAMERREFPGACAAYDALQARDSLDIAAAWGAGECRALDSLVVPARNSPTGLAFRGSWNAAIEAYTRVVLIDSRGYALPVYARLRSVLKTEPLQLRWGRTASGQPYFAWPLLADDTLVFFPITADSLARGHVNVSEEALLRARTALLQRALNWARLHPESAHALEAVAEAREIRRELGDDVSEGISALDAVRRARALARDTRQNVELGHRHVRLLLKRGEFAAARALGDTLLAAHPAPDPLVASQLKGIAALLGRPRLAGRLNALAAGAEIRPDPYPPEIITALADLETYAAMGICAGLDSRFARVRKLIDSHFAPEARERVWRDGVAIPARDAVPCSGGRSASYVPGSTIPVASLQRTYLAGDYRSVRAGLDSLTVRPRMRPGEFAIDYTYQQAWLRAAIGDTAGAATQLDRALTGVVAHQPTLLTRVREPAAFVRAMALRAELASAQGDARTAQRWRQAVWMLWSGADQEAKLALGISDPAIPSRTVGGN